MLKNAYFLEKNCKSRLSVPPVGLRRLGALPPDSRDVLPPTIATLSSSFL